MLKHAFCCMALFAGLSAHATNRVVTVTTDAGAGSLRDHITDAAPGDTITFDPSLSGTSIVLSSDIAFDKSLVILGPGSGNLSIDANFTSRIFTITGGDHYIAGLQLLNGRITGSFEYNGGAIKHHVSGTLKLKDIHFEFNDSRQSNGSQGGGLYYAVNSGRLELDSCRFTNNNADNYGGALSCNGTAEYCRINYCWFDGNSASTGPAGAIFSNADTLLIFNSTLSNNFGMNRASLWTGSNYDYALLRMVNSTFSHNTAANPSQIFDVDHGRVELINNTFHMDNEPILIEGDDHGGSDSVELVVQNNIFNNISLDLKFDEYVKYTSLGGNVCSDTSMRFFMNATNDTNHVAADIEYNSSTQLGFMPTHTILKGSVAIKNGTPGGPLTDQLGRTRTYLDAGAVDYICPVESGTDVQNVCGSLTWIDGNTYTSNTTNATFLLVDAAASGCDSLVTLHLTINPLPDNSTTRNGKTLSANNSNASYVWLDCDQNMQPISNATAQTFTVNQTGNYAVELTENGCKDTSECINVDLTGVEESSFAESLNVFPNPTTNLVTLQFGAMQAQLTLELRNALGQILERKEYTQILELQLELNHPKGVYFLVLSDGKQQQAIVRVVKN